MTKAYSTIEEPVPKDTLYLPSSSSFKAMRKEYGFTGAKRAKDVPHLMRLQEEASSGKTRITIFLDDDVLAAFRTRAKREGKDYQTLINAALRAAIAPEQAPLTLEALRRVLREELRTA